MIKYNIYVGLNDRQLLKQVIDSTKARNIVYKALLNSGIVAYTIYGVSGVFTNEIGKITREKTLKIEILDTKKCKVLKAIKEIKKLLNQESVLLEMEKKDISFI
jgi:hypothetical protein